MLHYRSFEDLNRTVVRNLHKIPSDVDLIAGIPRSGLMVANLLALHLHLPVTDIDGLRIGKVINAGSRMKNRLKPFSEYERILILDDSIQTGKSMNRVKEEIAPLFHSQQILFGAVYMNPDSMNVADFYFEECPSTRLFEWNIMNHPLIRTACVDIDGVLCVDPTKEQNDDGPRYRAFLKNVSPLFRITEPIGTLVTNRLEKYRQETESWLAKHNIRYGELVMRDLPSKEARQSLNNHGAYKASVYSARRNARVFIESSYKQSIDIARISGKPAYCTDRRLMIQPGHIPELKRKAKSMQHKVKQKFRKLLYVST